VVSQASESAGHFFNSLYPSVYGSFGYASSGNRYGVYGSAIDGTGTTNYAGYFYASGGGTNYGIRTYGSTYGIYASGGSYAVYAAGTLATSGNLVAESNTNGSGDGWHYCELDSATAGWQYCTCANGSFVGNLAVYNPGSYGVARDIATYCYKP